MENHIETNFREIQKILDSCIAHDYKTKVDALFLKREYLTQAQLKDYLRGYCSYSTKISCTAIYCTGYGYSRFFMGKQFL